MNSSHSRHIWMVWPLWDCSPPLTRCWDCSCPPCLWCWSPECIHHCTMLSLKLPESDITKMESGEVTFIITCWFAILLKLWSRFKYLDFGVSLSQYCICSILHSYKLNSSGQISKPLCWTCHQDSESDSVQLTTVRDVVRRDSDIFSDRSRSFRVRAECSVLCRDKDDLSERVVLWDLVLFSQVIN